MTLIAEKNTLTRPSEPSRGKRMVSAALSSLVAEVSRMQKEEVFSKFEASPEGLTEAEARERAAEFGPNELAREKEHGWAWRLIHTMRNPLVILLSVLATVAFATGDVRSGIVMSLMVVLGVVLRFVQESRADHAAAKLKAMML